MKSAKDRKRQKGVRRTREREKERVEGMLERGGKRRDSGSRLKKVRKMWHIMSLEGCYQMALMSQFAKY